MLQDFVKLEKERDKIELAQIPTYTVTVNPPLGQPNKLVSFISLKTFH